MAGACVGGITTTTRVGMGTVVVVAIGCPREAIVAAGLTTTTTTTSTTIVSGHPAQPWDKLTRRNCWPRWDLMPSWHSQRPSSTPSSRPQWVSWWTRDDCVLLCLHYAIESCWLIKECTRSHWICSSPGEQGSPRWFQRQQGTKLPQQGHAAWRTRRLL